MDTENNQTSPRGGSRPSGVGAAIASNSALSELVKELDRTRKEYSRSIVQLNQLQTTVQNLQDQADDKDGRIAELERTIDELKNENKYHQRESEEKHVATGTALAHRARHLEIEIQRLQRENESMGKLEMDNATLRETILDSQATIERLQLSNQDLAQRMKDGGGGATRGGGGGAMGGVGESGSILPTSGGGGGRGGVNSAYEDMEAQFQKKLATAEKRFRAEAYKALSEEAKSAVQGNDHLQVVLKRQNDSIEMVLARCRQLETAHDEVLRQNEEAGENLNLHAREVQKLTRSLEETRQKNRLLDEAMKQRKVERASLELLYVEYEQQKKKLQLTEEKAKRATREAGRWQDRAVQLTQELSDDQRIAAEKKLIHLQGMSNTIEDNAKREELRVDAKKRALRRQQEGARTLRALTESGLSGMASTGVGAELSMYGGGSVEDGVGRQMGIGADDILALWKATDHRREDEAEVGNQVLEERRIAAIATDDNNNTATTAAQNHQSTTNSLRNSGVPSESPFPSPPPVISTADIQRSVQQQQGNGFRHRSVADEAAEKDRNLSRASGPRMSGLRGIGSISANPRLPRMEPSSQQQQQHPHSADPSDQQQRQLNNTTDSLAEARRLVKPAPLPAGARHYAVPPVRRTEEYIKIVGRTEDHSQPTGAYSNTGGRKLV